MISPAVFPFNQTRCASGAQVLNPSGHENLLTSRIHATRLSPRNDPTVMAWLFEAKSSVSVGSGAARVTLATNWRLRYVFKDIGQFVRTSLDRWSTLAYPLAKKRSQPVLVV